MQTNMEVPRGFKFAILNDDDQNIDCVVANLRIPERLGCKRVETGFKPVCTKRRETGLKPVSTKAGIRKHRNTKTGIQTGDKEDVQKNETTK